jgi:hypothetical protein
MERTGFMQIVRYSAIILSLLCSHVFAGDTIIDDNAQGYSIFLPENWIKITRNDTQDIFYDSTFAHKSRLSIVTCAIDSSIYDTPSAWARAHFIAYKTFIDLDCYPFGAVLYWDTASNVRQDSLWACELYARFFSFDTAMFAWDEYVRFTASGGRGYEIYALGDTVDMKTNIGLYGAIIQAIEIINPITNLAVIDQKNIWRNGGTLYRRQNFPADWARYVYDLSGRNIPIVPQQYLQNTGKTPGIYIANRGPVIRYR